MWQAGCGQYPLTSLKGSVEMAYWASAHLLSLSLTLPINTCIFFILHKLIRVFCVGLFLLSP